MRVENGFGPSSPSSRLQSPSPILKSGLRSGGGEWQRLAGCKISTSAAVKLNLARLPSLLILQVLRLQCSGYPIR